MTHASAKFDDEVDKAINALGLYDTHYTAMVLYLALHSAAYDRRADVGWQPMDYPGVQEEVERYIKQAKAAIGNMI